MASWTVDGTSKPGILYLRLEGVLSESDMEGFVAAHNAAVKAFGGSDYRVFCDIRGLSPLSPKQALLFEGAKAFSSGQKAFRGSAVCVSSTIVAMQHQRTSVAGGVMDTELISDDEGKCWAHLATVHRKR